AHRPAGVRARRDRRRRVALSRRRGGHARHPARGRRGARRRVRGRAGAGAAVGRGQPVDPPLPPRAAGPRVGRDAHPRQPPPAQLRPRLRGVRPRRLAGPAAHGARDRRAARDRDPRRHRGAGAGAERAGHLHRRLCHRLRRGRLMRRFAALYERLDRSTGTADRRRALVDYFREAPPADAAWALWLLAGGKIGGARAKIATAGELRAWVGEESGTPDWLVEACHHQVGDLAETLALLLDDPPPGHDHAADTSLAEWIEGRLVAVAHAEPETRRAAVVEAWRGLPFRERLAFNKLLTGALRVGVSQGLVQQALAELSGVDIALIAQRMLGRWTPGADFMAGLLSPGVQPGDAALPYPFFLASPLEDAAGTLGPVDDWLLEWKWDGIRLQLIRHAGKVALWSRGEERMDGRFPEVEAAAAALSRDAVIDGELLAWSPDATEPLPFSALQTRIQRLRPGPKALAAAPARVLAYDLLELDGEDLRARPLAERRARLAD